MKKSNHYQIRQQFISWLLATFSIASLLLLPLQYLPLGLRRPVEIADTLCLHSWFPQGAPYWWTDIVPKVLVATLVLTAVFSLLNLRLLKKNIKPANAAAPVASAVSSAGPGLRAAPSAL
jgi:hypothetical protein